MNRVFCFAQHAEYQIDYGYLWGFSQLTQSVATIRFLDKSGILRLIFSHLSIGSRGLNPKADWVDIISYILYKFKSDCHWRLVPVQAFDSANKIS